MADQYKTLINMIYAVMTATNQEVLRQRMVDAVRAIGGEHFLLGVEVRKRAIKPVQHVTSGYPLRWQSRYTEKRYLVLDPTIRHCQRSTEPLVWHDEIYSSDALELLEESKSFGISYGLSIAVHETPTIKSMLSIARDKPIDTDAREQLAMVQSATVLASCAHMALTRLVVPALLADQRPHLTPRERDCLGYVMLGKSTSVISDLLKISQPTVDFHLKNVMRKMGVATRLQAVAMAAHLDLLE